MYQQKPFDSYNMSSSMKSLIRNKQLRILIIDDEDSYRKSMSFYLKKKYYARVIDFGSCLQAIQHVESGQSFDIAFIDIMMPEMNGIEAYLELKKIDPVAFIVLMSAYIDTKEWDKAKGLDVEMYAKPIPEEKMTKLLFNVASLLS